MFKGFALGLICCVAASQASAQTLSCTDFLAADPQHRDAYTFYSGQFAAGFAQAKFLSCTGAKVLPAGTEVDKHRLVECRFYEASKTYVELPQQGKAARIESICKTHPDLDLTRAVVLIFADINSGK